MNMLQLFLSLGIAYMAFCRLVHTDITTRATVRWSFAALGTAAVGTAISPWAFQAPAALWPILFQASLFAVMLAMSPNWKNGVPDTLRA